MEGPQQDRAFSFICEAAQKCGIACYIGEDDYIRARVRLTERNTKHEPVFMLQNALICLWDNREELSKESYALIKELGFKPRGKGAWLHFDRYEIGYTPIPLVEKEVELLTIAFENLYMMLCAIYEQGLDPEFDKGKKLERWYEPKTKLFYTHPFEIDISKGIITHPQVTVRENDWSRKVRSMKSAGYTIELDWSYLDIIYDDATVIIGLKQNPTYGRRFSPIILLYRAFCGAKRRMPLRTKEEKQNTVWAKAFAVY